MPSLPTLYILLGVLAATLPLSTGNLDRMIAVLCCFIMAKVSERKSVR